MWPPIWNWTSIPGFIFSVSFDVGFYLRLHQRDNICIKGNNVGNSTFWGGGGCLYMRIIKNSEIRWWLFLIPFNISRFLMSGRTFPFTAVCHTFVCGLYLLCLWINKRCDFPGLIANIVFGSCVKSVFSRYKIFCNFLYPQSINS